MLLYSALHHSIYISVLLHKWSLLYQYKLIIIYSNTCKLYIVYILVFVCLFFSLFFAQSSRNQNLAHWKRPAATVVEVCRLHQPTHIVPVIKFNLVAYIPSNSNKCQLLATISVLFLPFSRVRGIWIVICNLYASRDCFISFHIWTIKQKMFFGVYISMFLMRIIVMSVYRVNNIMLSIAIYLISIPLKRESWRAFVGVFLHRQAGHF